MTAKHKNPWQESPNEGPDSEENGKPLDVDHSDEENDPESDYDEVGELQSSLSELKEKQLRLLAEFDNYKKRTARERIDLLNSASKEVITSLLPILDDFERAFKTAASPDEGFREGIMLVYNRLLNVMHSQGVKAMDSTGEAFDPDLHDAITDVPVQDDSMRGKIIDTIEKGYMLNDKIIRHAKVVVGK